MVNIFLIVFLHQILTPMKNIFYIVLFVVLGTAQSFAQSIKDFKLLKGEKEVEVVFTYDNLRIQKDNFTEEEYKSKHKANLDKKTEGSGEIWVKSWERAKEDIWNPKFVVLTNKYIGNKVKFKQQAPDSKYILIVDVTWIYPGWDAGIMKQSAKVTSTVKLVSRENPTVVLAKYLFNEVPGDQFGSNFTNETRIGEGFAKTGKMFAKKIGKSL